MNTRLVLLIDPASGQCTGVMSLAGPGLEAVKDEEASGYHVANGLAYNKNTSRFIVTGKNWQNMYEISLSAPESLSLSNSKSKDKSAAQCLKEYVDRSNDGVVKSLLHCR